MYARHGSKCLQTPHKVGSIILVFTDEETEAQKALIICTRPNNVKQRLSIQIRLPTFTIHALKTLLLPPKIIYTLFLI